MLMKEKDIVAERKIFHICKKGKSQNNVFFLFRF